MTPEEKRGDSLEQEFVADAHDASTKSPSMTFNDQQRGVLSTDLARMINYTVIAVSLLAQFT